MPNGEIKVASNLTRVWSRINQDVTVAYGTDIDTAIEVVDEVGREMAADPVWKRRVLEAPRVERVERPGRDRGDAQDPRAPSARPTSGPPPGDFRRRLLAAFRANGIEIARPLGDVAVADAGGEPRPAPAAPDEDDLAEGTE